MFLSTVFFSSRLWNSLSAESFPLTYDLNDCRCRGASNTLTFLISCFYFFLVSSCLLTAAQPWYYVFFTLFSKTLKFTYQHLQQKVYDNIIQHMFRCYYNVVLQFLIEYFHSLFALKFVLFTPLFIKSLVFFMALFSLVKLHFYLNCIYYNGFCTITSLKEKVSDFCFQAIFAVFMVAPSSISKFLGLNQDQYWN